MRGGVGGGVGDVEFFANVLLLDVHQLTTVAVSLFAIRGGGCLFVKGREDAQLGCGEGVGSLLRLFTVRHLVVVTGSAS